MASSSSEQESAYEETFKKGTIVEVSSEDEGLRGSWYTATVIRSLSRKTYKILVEYHNLFADDAGSKPLRESVDAILVRPIPPREPHRVFSLMDDVDAFHHDGWWEGVVTKVFVLEPSKNYCYSVFFRCSREQIDFCPQDLRLHREWVRGNLWVPPLEHHCASPSSGPRKRNGEDGRNGYHGYHLAGDMDRGMGNGRDVRRKNGNTPTKQGLTMNGNCTLQRRSSSRIINNGASKKQGLTTYGEVRLRKSTTSKKVMDDGLCFLTRASWRMLWFFCRTYDFLQLLKHYGHHNSIMQKNWLRYKDAAKSFGYKWFLKQ